MALINCPECGREISDQATHCIHCGFPLSNYANKNSTRYLILCSSGPNRAQCAKLIAQYTNVSIGQGLGVCDSPREEIVFTDSDISKVQDAEQQFEAIGSVMRIASGSSREDVILRERLFCCPRCGSTTIATGARGVNGLFGFIGAGKTVNRCSKCGFAWVPGR